MDSPEEAMGEKKDWNDTPSFRRKFWVILTIYICSIGGFITMFFLRNSVGTITLVVLMIIIMFVFLSSFYWLMKYGQHIKVNEDAWWLKPIGRNKTSKA